MFIRVTFIDHDDGCFLIIVIIAARRYRRADRGSGSSADDCAVAIAQLIAYDRSDRASGSSTNCRLDFIACVNCLTCTENYQGSWDRPVLHSDLLSIAYECSTLSPKTRKKCAPVRIPGESFPDVRSSG